MLPPRHMTSPAHVDPITFSVIMSRLNAIVDEMTVTMEKAAYSSIIALARDYSCAIYDARCRQLCMYDALPIHTTSMHLVLEAISERFRGDVNDGDVFMANHPYLGNTHVGDVVMAAPVFLGDELAYWSVTKGHHQDIGAFQPTSVAVSARDVYQEGLTIPPLRVRSSGREHGDVLDLLLANLRYPEMILGDLLAQQASIEKGRVRLGELALEVGCETLVSYSAALLDYADRRMAAEIRAMPDGTYRGEAWIDSTGDGRVDVPVRVEVTIEGDRVVVDCSESGAQSESGMNGSFASTLAAVGMTFLCYVSPDIPRNEGCLRHIEVKTKKGTICDPDFPASTAAATIVAPNQLFDAVNCALAVALPDRVVAGGARSNNMPDLAGETAAGNWGAMLFNNNGGQGASLGADGWPMWGAANAMGGLKALPVEELELLHPILVDEMEVETDSMGCGEWIGGPGNRFSLRPLEGRIEVTTFADGYRNPPPGLLGGSPGSGGGQFVQELGSEHRAFKAATGRFPLRTGERWVGVSTGGGGFGDPLERDLDRVRQDVRDGFVSRERAFAVFGVVLDDAVDPALDREATAVRRAELRATGVEPAPVAPTHPGAGTWLEEQLREGDEPPELDLAAQERI